MVPVSLKDWGTVLSYLSTHCPPTLFRALVAEVSPVTVDDTTIAYPGQPVRIGCQSENTARWLADTFQTHFETAIRECTGCAFTVQFVPRDADGAIPVGPPPSIHAGLNSGADRRAAVNPSQYGHSRTPTPRPTIPTRSGPAAMSPAPTAANGLAPVGADSAADPLDALIPPADVGEFEQYRMRRRPGTDRLDRPASPPAPPMAPPSALSPAPSAAPSMHAHHHGASVGGPMMSSAPSSSAAPAKPGYAPATAPALPSAEVYDAPRVYTTTPSLPLNPHYTFEDFVVGPSNRLPHAAAMSVAEHPGVAYNPLFVHGSVGLGKTHLLQAISHRLMQNRSAIKLLYISCETFVSQYIRALQARELERFQHHFRDLDCLIIDDIHFLASKDGSQEEFFHTFNALTAANKQIVISSDSSPADIPHLQDRLVSRFKCGLQAKIDPPVFETRAAIFRQKAARHRLDLSDDIVHFLADSFSHNVREMEGAIKLLSAAAAGRPGPIDLPDVRRYLRDLLEEAQAAMPAPRTIEEIAQIVADYYGARIAELQSKNRQRHVVLPRQISMFLIKKLTSKTLEEIGGFFGGRDHSTVLHSIEKVRQMAESSADFRGTLSQLERKVSA